MGFRQNLDGHLTIQFGVPCSIHLTHTARTQQGDDLQVTEPQSTVGVSVLRGTALGNRDEAQGRGIRARSQGVRDQWLDDLIGDESASAICGDARLQFLVSLVRRKDAQGWFTPRH